MSAPAVLVTGATSPLGRKVCAALRARGARVIASGLEPDWDDPRIAYRPADLSHRRTVRELLHGPARDAEVEILIHLARHASAVSQGGPARRLDVDTVRWLLESAERHPTLRRLVIRSSSDVYRVDGELPTLVGETAPWNMARDAPEWVRDRVEADATACGFAGRAQLEIAIVRLADILSPGNGSLLYAYLEGPRCLRPLGLDPMVNVLSLEDATEALLGAAFSRGTSGPFNIPGADTLPLTECIRLWGRVGIPLPSPWIPFLYRVRRVVRGAEFSLGMNWRRFIYSAVLDGRRAKDLLGYVPRWPISWPAWAAQQPTQRARSAQLLREA